MLNQSGSIFQVLHIPARGVQGVGHMEDFQVLLFLFCVLLSFLKTDLVKTRNNF